MKTATLTPAIAVGQFDPAGAEGGVLCLEIGKDRFGFAVQERDGLVTQFDEYEFPSLLAEQSVPALLPGIFGQCPALQADAWQEIRVSVDSPSFTLIPTPLFRKEYAGNYLALMRGSVLPPQDIAQFYAHADQFYSVFSVGQLLKDTVLDQYALSPVTFMHQTSALLKAAAHLDRQTDTGQNMLLYFENEFVTIIFHDNHTLRFCNRFGYRTASDMTYFVLYVLEELDLQPATLSTTLYGEITPFAEAYSELKQFLGNMTFGSIPETIQLTDAFDDLPEHRYLSMYGLTLLSE